VSLPAALHLRSRTSGGVSRPAGLVQLPPTTHRNRRPRCRRLPTLRVDALLRLAAARTRPRSPTLNSTAPLMGADERSLCPQGAGVRRRP
jgi:hypothetical protein